MHQVPKMFMLDAKNKFIDCSSSVGEEKVQGVAITISIVKNDFIIIVVLLNEIMKLVFFLVVVVFILEVARE